MQRNSIDEADNRTDEMNTITVCLLALLLFEPSSSLAQKSPRVNKIESGTLYVICKEGCRVYIDGNFSGITKSDADGLMLPGVSPGEHHVSVQKLNFITLDTAFTVIPLKTNELKVQLRAEARDENGTGVFSNKLSAHNIIHTNGFYYALWPDYKIKQFLKTDRYKYWILRFVADEGDTVPTGSQRNKRNVNLFPLTLPIDKTVEESEKAELNVYIKEGHFEREIDNGELTEVLDLTLGGAVDDAERDISLRFNMEKQGDMWHSYKSAFGTFHGQLLDSGNTIQVTWRMGSIRGEKEEIRDAESDEVELVFTFVKFVR